MTGEGDEDIFPYEIGSNGENVKVSSEVPLGSIPIQNQVSSILGISDIPPHLITDDFIQKVISHMTHISEDDELEVGNERIALLDLGYNYELHLDEYIFSMELKNAIIQSIIKRVEPFYTTALRVLYEYGSNSFSQSNEPNIKTQQHTCAEKLGISQKALYALFGMEGSQNQDFFLLPDGRISVKFQDRRDIYFSIVVDIQNKTYIYISAADIPDSHLLASQRSIASCLGIHQIIFRNKNFMGNGKSSSDLHALLKMGFGFIDKEISTALVHDFLAYVSSRYGTSTSKIRDVKDILSDEFASKFFSFFLNDLEQKGDYTYFMHDTHI